MFSAKRFLFTTQHRDFHLNRWRRSVTMLYLQRETRTHRFICLFCCHNQSHRPSPSERRSPGPSLPMSEFQSQSSREIAASMGHSLPIRYWARPTKSSCSTLLYTIAIILRTRGRATEPFGRFGPKVTKNRKRVPSPLLAPGRP